MTRDTKSRPAGGRLSFRLGSWRYAQRNRSTPSGLVVIIVRVIHH